MTVHFLEPTDEDNSSSNDYLVTQSSRESGTRGASSNNDDVSPLFIHHLI